MASKGLLTSAPRGRSSLVTPTGPPTSSYDGELPADSPAGLPTSPLCGSFSSTTSTRSPTSAPAGASTSTWPAGPQTSSLDASLLPSALEGKRSPMTSRPGGASTAEASAGSRTSSPDGTFSLTSSSGLPASPPPAAETTSAGASSASLPASMSRNPPTCSPGWELNSKRSTSFPTSALVGEFSSMIPSGWLTCSPLQHFDNELAAFSSAAPLASEGASPSAEEVGMTSSPVDTSPVASASLACSTSSSALSEASSVAERWLQRGAVAANDSCVSSSVSKSSKSSSISPSLSSSTSPSPNFSAPSSPEHKVADDLLGGVLTMPS